MATERTCWLGRVGNRRTVCLTRPGDSACFPNGATRRRDMTTRPVENLEPIALPAPVLDGGRTLLEALKMRRTSRDISGEKIPLQVLSDILWAAQGVNRATGPFGDPGRLTGRQATQRE